MGRYKVEGFEYENCGVATSEQHIGEDVIYGGYSSEPNNSHYTQPRVWIIFDDGKEHIDVFPIIQETLELSGKRKVSKRLVRAIFEEIKGEEFDKVEELEVPILFSMKEYGERW